MTIRYLIIQIQDLDKIDFSQILETSKDTLRKSIDGTKTVIKWQKDTPEFIHSLSKTEGPYTHEEILQVLSSSEWGIGKKPFDSWTYDMKTGQWTPPYPKPDDGKRYDWNEEFESWIEVINLEESFGEILNEEEDTSWKYDIPDPT